MDLEKKLELVKRPPTEEIITEEDLRGLLQTNDHPGHYIGFEISGLLHLGNLLVTGNKVNDLAKAGFKCTIYLADYHSFLNNKLGGNWENILKAAKYYAEAFKFYCPDAKIVLGSDLYSNNDEYWKDVIRFSKRVTLQRNLRCVTIMGRNEKENLDCGQLLYPPMQGVDVKYLGSSLPHGGMDQRKIHVLCREVFPKLGWKKPVALHNHLLAGLTEPEQSKSVDKLERTIAAKMSKSKPGTAVFIHDSENQILEKLNQSWCPPKSADGNPVLEIAEYILFAEAGRFVLERDKKYGGKLELDSYKELEEEYSKGNIHPGDLKPNVARELSKILSPIRKHFEKKSELLEVYKNTEITR